MRALVHRSHHSSARPDGWSGAPDEARYIGEVIDRLIPIAVVLGVEVVTVDGDLEDHPEFHDPTYALFWAPHYESDTHGAGGSGWFWGRAAKSPTGTEDDRLGAIFERRYRELLAATGGPDEREDWMTVNVTDYYGFRLDRAVPGILTELGIGAPGARDHDWLRAHQDDIARVIALSIAEYGGLWPGKEEHMDPEQERRVIDAIVETGKQVAASASVYVARAQRGLDVETGKPFDPSHPPVDPRVRT
ncbi:MAG: hypothetical protein KGK07_06390 [Chloroflexota bacterium]|nr:hypothetical protein [Chloroflexota bacterium]